ncbi:MULTISPECIES: nitrogen fixation protein NifQ [Paraburkholderia]|uniref:nitrogen fixation protein NifQ n=1 Tax=Paraburkholderia TaxID=1822464 RepID=UPI00224D2CD8|nr:MULTISPECIES: nitrogen fixation protein NifQ [Paraburkholderia]MCX4173033.1 nitrogen fixation protein NifQ [Paraburkholderia madseniana]MDQ6461041.1 nitrogen fixation protein NifQ [Paraburkholderia madseniana]
MSDEPPSPVAEPAAPSREPLFVSLDARVAERTAKWLAAATDAASPDTQLFARLIAARDVRDELTLLGLPQPAWRALLERHFVHAPAPVFASLPGLPPVDTSEHATFVETLHALLLTYASAAVDTNDVRCLASIIAHACLRPDHLWRDLGLAGREEVTWMLTRYFPALVLLNVDNLRWKKFLAQQRALSLGLQPGPAPGCPGCEDYGHCFPGHP